MRHKDAHRKLGRTSAHRKALFKNMSIALIEHGRIETTLPKAKEMKSFFEKLITKAKAGDSNAHRAVFAVLQNKEAVKKLVGEIAPRYASRNGGYTSITKTGMRRGDAADMAILELVQ
ncbi:MAG: 50S ribosomal protein L17 [Campylobacterales bacterium]